MVTLVVLTGIVGMMVAPGHLHPVLAVAAVLCIAVAAGAAGAINMWFDRDIDAVMARTSRRGIPRARSTRARRWCWRRPGGRIGDRHGTGDQRRAAAWLAVSIAFYVFVYTMWLKRRTPQNIVIGGAAGAFPPIIGWARSPATRRRCRAAVRHRLPVDAAAFWALALYACKDYGRAGIPMLPVVRGARHTRWQILLYTLVLLPFSVLPWLLGLAGVTTA